MSMIFHRTAVGEFHVVDAENYRCKVLFDGECLGTYDSWDEAVNALCSGEVFQPSGRFIDFDILEIPRNTLEWQYVAG